MIRYYTTVAGQIPFENRIKSIQSCELKYSKYYPDKAAEKAFNDILGIRITIDSYELVDDISFPPGSRIADMREGKAFDDGYRGIHIYIQKNHLRYPIEIQFITPGDKQFNAWLHDNTYKYINNCEVGKILRKKYDDGVINNLEEFKEELENVLCNC